MWVGLCCVVLGWLCLVGLDSDFDGVVDHSLYGYHYLHASFSGGCESELEMGIGVG